MPRRNIVDVPPWVQDNVSLRIKQLIDVANNAYNRAESYPMPKVTYDVTGRVAAKAWGCKQIMINSVLLMENVDTFIDMTVRHEVAHCIDFVNNNHSFPKSKTGTRYDFHGKSWQNVMRELGDRYPSRCHHYDTSRAVSRNTRKYVYVCPSCLTNLPVTNNMHNKIQYERQVRVHRLCKTPIIFSHEINKSN